MKKIALALIALVALLSPLAAGESWIGVTTGPSFDIQKQGDADAFTDFGWDVNVEGTYYFNEAETIGLGVKLGVGFNYDSTYSVDIHQMVMPLFNEAISKLPEDQRPGTEQVSALLAQIPASVKNPSAGIKLAPAITFQYRLALTENLDLRLGAGLQYIHTFGKGISFDIPAAAQSFVNGMEKFEAEVSMEALEIIANADVAYSFGDFQIFGGVDLGFTVMTYLRETMLGETHGEFITDGFGFSITPRVGVSYAF